ncbi:MAG: GntG family PLP-dependent aldolase [Candidatus Pseudobacter hemicellulosilyticus]|uniref:GntG family PLP-dependent aldolase n=1 Tax=Candidatus Pseudobacter hemicellulosilyticus TaxID=3121375 RepID=A0AAJ5WSK6_9BACT|nr:MAG: GntG family PLP-dependent aldolase [Pseudobacter sp.]
MMSVDLRSDTFTKPTPGMLKAMLEAEVGDDVFGEDPTVNRLEATMAALFGMEAALYCPSGTMSNQIAIKAHTHPGDEVICDKTAHVYQYEAGGIAFNSGAQVKLLDGDHGRFTAAQVLAAINPDDIHKPPSTLVCLENTANRGGGSCYSLPDIQAIRAVCQEQGMALHLDGARLFNAMVATGTRPAQYGELFHSISVCLNKGLGCPMGSVLLGNREFIRKSRRIRKVLGGGTRQAGYMAASGLYALENQVDRLATDHEHARQLAAALTEKEFISGLLPVVTNIVIAETVPAYPAARFTEALRQEGILAIPIAAHQFRLVLHLGVTEEMVQHSIRVIRDLPG